MDFKMAIFLTRSCDYAKPSLFWILCSSTHIGLKDNVKGAAWRRGYRNPPYLLQQTIDYYNGKEADVKEVLEKLEEAALLVPGIWRTDIRLRKISDPFNIDPNFDSDGYIFGMLIPEDSKIPVSYFRLLAFKYTRLPWKNGVWISPYTILMKNPKWKRKKPEATDDAELK